MRARHQRNRQNVLSAAQLHICYVYIQISQNKWNEKKIFSFKLNCLIKIIRVHLKKRSLFFGSAHKQKGAFFDSALAFITKHFLFRSAEYYKGPILIILFLRIFSLPPGWMQWSLCLVLRTRPALTPSTITTRKCLISGTVLKFPLSWLELKVN